MTLAQAFAEFNQVVNPIQLSLNVRIPDLPEYVEGMNYQQILIALEGAFNTVVSAAVNNQAINPDYEMFEEEIRANTLEQLMSNVDADTVDVGLGYESQYDSLVNKLAMDITDDYDNPDVQVMYNEMYNASWMRINLYHYMDRVQELRLVVSFHYDQGPGTLNGVPEVA
ncbi:hypothetical protein PQC07_gp206 [Aeromonas phage D3]|uniref:Uncharacterized protein n=2 Tax=Ludhianavirus TaxID=3044751 RepID=A0A514TVL4_9CAUD|nr:hypothetical protein PQC07_gp206 [Aeromonas phage D3]YP_010668815.1 hypothetical protein PQC08_gp208 [Aeromonas phage D6]QDJ97066.1 hypothetical protein D3_0069 [Aeromonas phage D3]QDJ97227.1 hypothetical protein D6_0067 [Aeromonas phage D6]QEP52372.1 hypothetical protein D9_0165 [Aeromonas phage D9]